jgi:hypothetical protein
VHVTGEAAKVLHALTQRGGLDSRNPRLKNIPQAIQYLRSNKRLRIMALAVWEGSHKHTRYWLLDRVSFALEVRHGS